MGDWPRTSDSVLRRDRWRTCSARRSETLKLLAFGIESRRGKDGELWNCERLRRSIFVGTTSDTKGRADCSRMAYGIRIIQLILGHAGIQQRYLNVRDEELRRELEVSWEKKKRLRLVSGA